MRPAAAGQVGLRLGTGRNRCDGTGPQPLWCPPGRACLAVVGPVERTLAIATGDDRRAANMAAFANAALGLFADVLSAAVS